MGKGELEFSIETSCCLPYKGPPGKVTRRKFRILTNRHRTIEHTFQILVMKGPTQFRAMNPSYQTRTWKAGFSSKREWSWRRPVESCESTMTAANPASTIHHEEVSTPGFHQYCNEVTHWIPLYPTCVPHLYWLPGTRNGFFPHNMYIVGIVRHLSI